MKKLLLVPAVVAVAAISSASAAGFVGGVSAGPLQTGQTDDLTCAASARVVEWGTNDHLPTPNVVNARVLLADANCGGQAIFVAGLGAGGGIDEAQRATAGRIADQPAGPQYARVTFPTPINVEDLDDIRITIDPGYTSLTNILPIN